MYLRIHVVKAMPSHFEGIASDVHYAPVQRGLPFNYPNVCNEQPSLSLTTCVCRMVLSSDTLYLFGSLLSGNPNPLSKLVGRYWSTAWCLLYAYSSHTQSGGTEGPIVSVAAADTLNGFRSSRSRRTAPVWEAKKPKYHERENV